MHSIYSGLEETAATGRGKRESERAMQMSGQNDKADSDVFVNEI